MTNVVAIGFVFGLVSVSLAGLFCGLVLGGIMLGLGETRDEVFQAMDLVVARRTRDHFRTAHLGEPLYFPFQLSDRRPLRAFQGYLTKFPRLLIPKVIEGYTTHRVLTMERIRGVKIDEVPPVSRLEQPREPRRRVHRLALRQVDQDRGNVSAAWH